jgi:hypothetical protein
VDLPAAIFPQKKINLAEVLMLLLCTKLPFKLRHNSRRIITGNNKP